MSQLAPDPIVILGAPRSGTTYLQGIMVRHPEVAISNEVRLFEWLRRATTMPDDERVLFGRADEFLGHLRRELPGVIRSWYAAMAPRARWWGDKNPHYAESRATLDTIVELFPGARFVHIVRDPRAVIGSLLKKRHADGRPWVIPEEAHVLVGTHLNIAAEFGQACGGERFFELRYEDLVADDEARASELFEWLGIPFTDEVAAFCRSQQRERTAFSGPTSDLGVAGGRAEAIAAWSAALPADARPVSLQFLAPFLLRYGYEDEASLDAANRSLPGE
ncbi:MAG: sulfotransferase [Planctomycetes bacterium]|nr:sulfotransferase [Planctomycetota bacterium]